MGNHAAHSVNRLDGTGMDLEERSVPGALSGWLEAAGF